MSEIADLIEPLKRAVAPPGRFDRLFPESTNSVLEGYVLDAIAEAQLDGFLSGLEVNDDEGLVTPDLTRDGGSLKPGGSLVLLYAAARILDNEIRNRQTHTRYESKGALAEEDQTASLLIQLHKDMKARLSELRELARYGDSGRAFYMADMAYLKAISDYEPDPAMLGGNWSAMRALTGGR